MRESVAKMYRRVAKLTAATTGGTAVHVLGVDKWDVVEATRFEYERLKKSDRMCTSHHEKRALRSPVRQLLSKGDTK